MAIRARWILLVLEVKQVRLRILMKSLVLKVLEKIHQVALGI
jgi:hypothetical protein